MIKYLLIIVFTACVTIAQAQMQDSISIPQTTISSKTGTAALPQLLKENFYLNSQGTPAALVQIPRKSTEENYFFYIISGLLLILGIAKSIYARYFANMFRVFFNSSLRQSQLTDQLVQDQLPALIFNILFICVAGIYAYLVIVNIAIVRTYANWRLIGICVGLVAIIYIVKYFSLKFTGWVTGFKQEAGVYIFIVFLINKIIAIVLLPVIIILAFSSLQIVKAVLVISFILVGLLLIMRFFRSYSLIQHRLKISRFHFILYIFSMEILPLLLIYKGAVLFISISM